MIASVILFRRKQHRVILFIFLIIISGILIIQAGCLPDAEKKSVVKKIKADPGRISALPLTYKDPADNPSTKEKTELGRLLFYDPVLSGKKDVSCASCHHPEFGYAESIELSIGVNGRGLGENRKFISPNNIPFTKRNSQTLLNVAFNGITENGNYLPSDAPMFWDLRAKSLEQQALHPIKQLEEMRGHDYSEQEIIDVVIKRLNAVPEYRNLFTKAFNDKDAITSENLGKALACFQRSLLANNSRFDRYMRGDNTAMGSSELDGMKLFMDAGCARCHNGPMFSDFKAHVMGVKENEKLTITDSGLNKTFAFRTPTLRNLKFTRPYMHNGKIQTLNNVLEFYEDLHGKEPPDPNVSSDQIDSLAKMIKLEFKDISSIVEFLNALNDDKFDKKIPGRVPSGLAAGGNIR
jgi:cytochrome c peroxidase